jgi:diguanylate cyclase (GGDEF)-like protein/PAS domain S-box-containing protein
MRLRAARAAAPQSSAPDGQRAGNRGSKDTSFDAQRDLSPRFVAYAVGPIALAMLVVLRHFGLVANVPLWAYLVAIGSVQVLGRLTDRWPDAPPGTLRLHVRVVLHVASVASVIYMSGWGPVLGMAFAFSAQSDIEHSGAAAWRAALAWSLTACGICQLMVFEGWIPSFLNQWQAQTIGFLGAFVFAIATRMAGAIGARQERTERLLEWQTIEAVRSAALHRAVVENAAEGILTIGLDGRIESFNAAAETIFGWSADEIVGQSVTEIVPTEFHAPFGEFLAVYGAAGPRAIHRKEVEIRGLRRGGEPFPMSVSTSAIAIEGSPPTISGIVRDLSHQKLIEAQLEHQVLHDPLTGLANRVMFTDHLEQALARLRRGSQMFALLFVDLDRFKVVNDSLGHNIGDRLLMEAAARIKSAVRETDTVARHGGDEFVVLCEDLEAIHDATEIAERVIHALGTPFRFDNDDVASVSASIGISLTIDGNECSDSVLRNADIAMYRAKQHGGDRFELFDEVMQEWVAAQHALEVALRHAIPRNELRVFYQPVVALDSAEICGFEALVRWQHPQFGLMTPDKFIPIAEESGLIVDIGTWMIEQASRDAASWAAQWPDRRLDVAVNLSSHQLLSRDIVRVVSTALATAGLQPAALTLELTESTLFDDVIDVRAILGELRQLGISLALDDFGTGYSSLTHLRNFPISVVKIDRSFVRAIGTEKEDTAIVAAVIGLARNLRLRVVAEGVETPAQLAVLHQLGCDYVQGYLLSEPVPNSALPELIRRPATAFVPAPAANA